MTDAVEQYDVTTGAEIEIVSGNGGPDVEHDIMTMKEGRIALVSSIPMDEFEGALEVAEALGNSTPLEDKLNVPFTIRDYIVQKVTLLDAATNTYIDAPRTTLITTDGEYLHATSKGVFSSVKNLIGLVGTPDRWPNRELTLVATRERTRGGFNTILLKPVRKAAKGK